MVIPEADWFCPLCEHVSIHHTSIDPYGHSFEGAVVSHIVKAVWKCLSCNTPLFKPSLELQLAHLLICLTSSCSRCRVLFVIGFQIVVIAAVGR